MKTVAPSPDEALVARLQDRLHQLARERDPYFATAGHFFVQDYIRTQFGQWGTVERHDFTLQASGRLHHNLVLNLPGTSNHPAHRGTILVGAHYDAVPGTPGADDNASGVAVLLELARLFAEQPARRPIRLVAFDLEEYDRKGSYAYSAQVWRDREPIRLMISLEMLGYFCTEPHSQLYPPGLRYFYPSTGDFIALVGNLTALPDLLSFSRRFRSAGVPCQWLPAIDGGKFVKVTRFSDHSPFWDRGYRAMMITDTAFLRNPNYHKPSDRIETLNFNKMASICEGLAVGLRQL
ncbi:M28 family peptidase [Altericista sp. CCNU0014]|uniref:M28 family peptidase n=1 Tax=Altericista sp. CCNU0014 TaxID=3082949 RepID=UPI00384E0F40